LSFFTSFFSSFFTSFFTSFFFNVFSSFFCWFLSSFLLFCFSYSTLDFFFYSSVAFFYYFFNYWVLLTLFFEPSTFLVFISFFWSLSDDFLIVVLVLTLLFWINLV
jgi:hypothetical protein